MTQEQKNVQRQAIKEQQKKAKQLENERKQQVLTGVIDNESKTYTFNKTITLMGGEKREGTFKAKYMGVTARLRIGTIRAKLLDGAPAQSVDQLTDDIAYMIAYLTVALVETPRWWSYDALDEFTELREMYMEVYEFIQSFRHNDGASADAGHSTDADGTETVEDK